MKLIISITLLLTLMSGVGAASMITVDDSGGADYTSIQEAINAAYENDTIYVFNGTYCESVHVHKRVTLIGEGADVVTVRAASSLDDVFKVDTDWVNITGFTVSGGNAGIDLDEVHHCNISYNIVLNSTGSYYGGIRLSDSSDNILLGNTANNNSCGISLSDSSDNILRCNNCSIWLTYYSGRNTLTYNNCSNNGYGIRLDHSSSNNILVGNTANNNGCGISLDDSGGNTLTNNLMAGNGWNFRITGDGDSHFNNEIDTTNIVDGKTVCYIKSASDMTFNSTTNADAGIIYCIQCNNITIRDLTLTNNGAGVLFWETYNSEIEDVNVSNNCYGIYLGYSDGNTVKNNTAFDTSVGIRLSHSSDNIITDNNASNGHIGIGVKDYSNCNTLENNIGSGNGFCGIFLERSSNNMLTGNIISNNDYGIFLVGSCNSITGNTASHNNDYGIWVTSNSNTLYHNNLINNNISNAYDECINTWDSGSEGNYYSNYAGNDPDGDGIGDSTYPIYGGYNVDHYPLMQPWSAPPPKGDLNGDNQITPADAAIALQIAVGSRPCDPATLTAADVSGDGSVTSLDALMILQAAAGSIEIG